MARLDLGVVEHVVEDAQQRLARHPHHVQVLALLRRQLGVTEQIDHAQHRVHRGADLVAHVGDEFALGPVGGLGTVALAFEFLGARRRFEPHPVLLGHIGNHRQHLGALVGAHRAQVDLDRELGAVLAQAVQHGAASHAHRLGAEALGKKMFALGGVAVAQGRRHQHLDCAAQQLVARVAEAAFALAVGGFDAAIHAHHQDGVGRVLEHALQAGVGGLPFAHQVVERGGQLAHLVVGMDRQWCELGSGAAQCADGVAQLDQGRQQARGQAAHQQRRQQRGQAAPQQQAREHAIERLVGFGGRQRYAQHPVHRFQRLVAVEHFVALGVDAVDRTLEAVGQRQRGGAVELAAARLQQAVGVRVQHVHRLGTAREGKIVAAGAHRGVAQVAEEVVLVQPQHAGQDAHHFAARVEHGRDHLHDRLALVLAQHRFGNHRLAGVHHLLEVSAVGHVHAHPARHRRHVGDGLAVGAIHHQFVEQRQDGAVLVVRAQALGRGAQVGRLLAGGKGDDLEQRGQLVVEFLGGAAHQCGLLGEQHPGEIVLDPLHLNHGHQGDHQDRGDAGCQCNFRLDPKWFHVVLVRGLRGRKPGVTGIFLSKFKNGNRIAMDTQLNRA